jgi:hypothetical protein
VTKGLVTKLESKIARIIEIISKMERIIEIISKVLRKKLGLPYPNYHRGGAIIAPPS